MDKTYDLGLDSNRIYVEVTVSTEGIVSTNVTLTNPDTLIAESNNQSGNIPETFLGVAKDIRNSELLFYITINLGSIDKTLWKAALDKIDITYILSGGYSGLKKIEPDKTDIRTSPKGKIVYIEQWIKWS